MAQRRLRKSKSTSEQDEQEEQEPIYEEQEESRYVNGVVKFSNISVRNLKKMDAFGKSDPFVVFRAGDEEQKTTTAKNTLDYDYTNEEYDLIYNPLKMQGKKEVEVEVWDYDSVGSNDLIGTVSVDIFPAMNNQVQYELFLQPKSEDQSNISQQNIDQKLGKIIFKMKYIPEDDYLKKIKDEEMKKKKIQDDLLKQIEDQQKRQIENLKQKQDEDKRKLEEERIRKVTEDAKYVKGYVTFSHIAVRNLKKMDLIGKTDPYVVFKLGDESKQTTVAKEQLDYDYLNETYEIIYDPSKNQLNREVEVSVWDYDSVGSNDLVGSVNVDILPAFNKQIQTDLFLQPKKEDQTNSNIITSNSDQKLGKVIFQMIYISESDWIKKFEKEQIRKKKEEEEQIKNRELEEKRKNDEIQKIAEEYKRKLEDARIRKEAEDAKYVKGVVKFSNISVRNIPKMDLVGKTDPYVVFKLGDESKQTTVAKEQLDYDYLNETYEIIYDPSKNQLNREVEVSVWDYDSVGSNDLVGSVNVDILPSLNQQQQIELYLQPKLDQSKSNISQQNTDQKLGKVSFSMLYISEFDLNKQKEDEQVKKKKDLEEKQRKQQELIKQKEAQLQNIQEEEKRIIEEQKRKLEEERIRKVKEERRKKEQEQLKIEEEQRRKEEVERQKLKEVERQKLKEAELVKQRKKKEIQIEKQKQIDEQNKKKKEEEDNKQKLKDELEKQKLDEIQKKQDEEKKQKLEKKKRLNEERKIKEEEITKQWKGVIQISQISVHNLKKLDTVGKTDPYVVFRIGDEYQHTTIASNTLDYEYVNEQLEIMYDPVKCSYRREVEVEVWDYDSVGKNELVGTVNVDVFPLFTKQTKVNLFIQPKNLKIKESPKTFQNFSTSFPDLTQKYTDKKIGKVQFTIYYMTEQEWINNNQEKYAILKIKEDQQRNLQEEEERKKQEELLKQQLQEIRLREMDEQQYIKGVVKISKISVRNIKQMNLIRKTNPFVIFKMGPEQQQTSVAQETLNYDYLNEDFELIYHPLVMLAKREIEVEVWDYNNTGSNDLVGSVVVDVLPSFKTKIQVEKFLQPKQKSLQSESEEDDENDSPLGPDNNLGRVIFSVIYMSEQDWVKKLHDDEINKVKEEEEMKLKIELEVKKRQEEENKQLEEQRKIKEKQAEMFSKGYLKFSNISVRDLKKMDTIGKTDPYVVFQLGELQKQTTVAKNTLSYDYKNEEIELEYNSYLNQWTGKADVQVWDYDTLGKNDLIGSVVVDV